MRFVSATLSIERGDRLSAAGCQRTLPIERLLPHAFVGEKVAKPDEGAFDSSENVADLEHLADVRTPCRTIARHPSSAFGTFSPRRSPRGEGARLESGARTRDKRSKTIRDKRSETIRDKRSGYIACEVCQRHSPNRARREVSAAGCQRHPPDRAPSPPRLCGGEGGEAG